MKKASFSKKKQFAKKEKLLEKRHLRWIYLLAIIAIGYYYFIEPKLIGHDSRYLIFVFLIPTLLGMAVLGIYRRNFLISRFANYKGPLLWTFMIIFYAIQGALFSYLSFGQVAKMSWDYWNYRKILKNPEEILICPVTRFWAGRSARVEFMFRGRYEHLGAKYSSLKDFVKEEPSNYILRIRANKGLWNYYTVHDWTIEHK